MKKINLILIPLLIAIIATNTKYADAAKRPIYNIAHMCNSIDRAKEFLEPSLGANGIEVDVTFTSNGQIDRLYHGIPCDCGRICTETENFTTYLTYIRSITSTNSEDYNPNLSLLYLDTKLSKVEATFKSTAGRELANSLITNLFSNGSVDTTIYIVIAVEFVSDKDFIIGFENELNNRQLSKLNDLIGFDVGAQDKFEDIEQMWNEVRINYNVKNIWLDDGLTNCYSYLYHLLGTRDTDAIAQRDKSPESYFKKVCYWTIDLEVHMKLALGQGVDAIITNQPKKLHDLINDEYGENFRLATINDNPFARFTQ